jgi:hypothetical protein
VTCVLGARGRRQALERIVDLTVFAPIGLLAVVRDHRGELAATARGPLVDRIAAARRVGDLAVAEGRREVQRRVEPAAHRPGPAATAPAADHAGPSARTGPAVDVEPDAADAAGRADAPLPIEGYEHLAASQIVMRLAALDDAELDAVESFERAHRNRRTIHGRIAQLRAER